ncbi:MAG: primosomal protein N', partial [Clostridiales bacterium]|nr:primosomal protein N' [Clostridiales bacterium]
CGYVPTCPGCTVNLTYHKANGRLMCHYCGHSEVLPARCPECGGHLKQIGFGTQKVQEQLHNLLPDTEILRMDADTVSAVNTHEKLLTRFREENIPILLGTQMVAKGLNFENVTLVGVLDADMSLYVGSYRAAETTFSMITQVIGRAGRGAENGRALIQTMTPKNQVIALAAQQDYDTFYETELPLRSLRGCPPYRDLLTVTFHGREEERIWQAAQRFRAMLKSQLESDFYRQEQVQLLGPAPAQVAKLNYSYRCCLTLSCKNTRSLRQLLAHLMREFSKDKQNNGVGIFADVNRNE